MNLQRNISKTKLYLQRICVLSVFRKKSPKHNGPEPSALYPEVFEEMPSINH